MNMKDKNGETASQRIARKVMRVHDVNERNTVTHYYANFQICDVFLYSTLIARVDHTHKTVTTYGRNISRLTAHRLDALELAALDYGYIVTP